ncbi:PhoU domain-containing protein [Halorubrum sp. SY-15]|uniref:PhoU domain-containing protein n=1 Tax=Halorubrum sp. SY-15 TaxID=3402277 RepID=UPI003EC0D7F4
MTDEYETYERKVQLTGGTTYTVSLPKTWANEHSLEIGDAVTLHPRSDRLVLTRESGEPDQRTVTVSAGRHAPAGIARLVAAAYVSGADTVHVEGSPDRQARAAIREAVGGFVGLEIAEETERTVTARTMLDVADLPPERTLDRMRDRTLEMHEAAMAAVLEGDGEAGRRVAGEDDTVDRLFGLLAREFHRSLVAVPAPVDGTLTPFDHYTVARQLERVADHAGKIADAATTVETPPPVSVADDLERLAADAREVVRLSVTETLGGCEPRALGAVVTEADALRTETRRVDRELYDRGLADGYVLATVLDSITRTIEYGVNVAEAGLRVALRADDTVDGAAVDDVD